MSSNPPSPLPGFLRRSLRNPYEEEVEDESVMEESEIVKEGSVSAAGAVDSIPPPPEGETERNGSEEEEEVNINRRFRLTFRGTGGSSNFEEGDDGDSKNDESARKNRNGNAKSKLKRASSAPLSDTSTSSAELVQERPPSRSGVNESSSVGDFEAPSPSHGPTSPPSTELPSNSLRTSSSTTTTPTPTTTTTPTPTSQRNHKPTYKETTFNRTISSPVVNIHDLRRLGWNGIPPQHRSTSWKILLGYLPANSSRRSHTILRKRLEYKDAIAQHYDIDDDTRTSQEQETLRQVLVDVPRTAPEVLLFRNERVRVCLGRLLYIWACRHPASSYVQGINDLATPLIGVFLSGYFGGVDVLDGRVMEDVTDEIMDEVEADCYWCLTNLLSGIQDHYTADQPGVQRMVMRLEELVARIDSDLMEHLRGTGIEFMQFSFKWMNCLLLREFNLQCVMRLWDTYLSEGDGGFENFHVYVCAAFLCQFSGEIRQMDFDELFGFMQNIPTTDWGDDEIEILLSQAFVLSTLFGGSDAHLTSQRP